MKEMILTSICAAALLVCGVALGDDSKAEAKRHFEAGLTLFKAEKYEAAALELEASVRLYPTKGGVFNLASVYKVMSRYGKAIEALDTLEEKYGASLGAAMREEAVRMRSEIEALAAEIDVEVSVAGATVIVDGRKVGKSPLPGPVLVDPGKHDIRASVAGRESTAVSVKLLSGQSEKVVLTIPAKAGSAIATASVDRKEISDDPSEEPKADEATAQAQPEPVLETEREEGEGEGERKKIGPVPLVAAAVVMAGTAVGAVVLGVKAEDEAEAAKEEGSRTRMDKADSLQKAGQALFGVAIAAGVTAVVLAFFTDYKSERETSAGSARVELEGVWPVALEGGGGAAVGVRF